MTSTNVRKYIHERPLGAVFTARECMNFGNSTAVYKCLMRAIRDGYIVRVAWGAYFRPDPGRPDYQPPLVEIVLAKDKAFGRNTLAHECQLLDDIMANPHRYSSGSPSDDFDRSCCHGSFRAPAFPNNDDRKELTMTGSATVDDDPAHEHECASRAHLKTVIEEPAGINGFSCSAPLASNGKTVSLVKGSAGSSAATAVLKYETLANNLVAGSVIISVSTARKDCGPAASGMLKDENLDNEENPEFESVAGRVSDLQEHVSKSTSIQKRDEICVDKECAKRAIALVSTTEDAVSKSTSKLSSEATKPLLHILNNTADTPSVSLNSTSRATVFSVEGLRDSLVAAGKTSAKTATLKDAVFDTDGNTSSFNTIHGRVYLHRVSARKMQLGGSAEGVMLRALWRVGESNLDDSHIMRAIYPLGRQEKEKLRERLWLAPNWLKDALVLEEIWKYSRPAA